MHLFRLNKDKCAFLAIPAEETYGTLIPVHGFEGLVHDIERGGNKGKWNGRDLHPDNKNVGTIGH